MRITVVGSNGRAGRAVVRSALERGYDVTAAVRDPAKLAALGADADRVQVAVSDVTDVDSLRAAFDGADAVAYCVGPVAGESSDVQSAGIASALEALGSSPCRRVVALSASGLQAERGDDPFTRFIAKPLVQRILAGAFADLRLMEERLRASDRDWTIVRPPRLRDAPAKGRYRSRTGRGIPFGVLMTYGDLGTAIVDVIENQRTVGHTVMLAN